MGSSLSACGLPEGVWPFWAQSTRFNVSVTYFGRIFAAWSRVRLRMDLRSRNGSQMPIVLFAENWGKKIIGSEGPRTLAVQKKTDRMHNDA